jgi:hypothetical protein
MFQDCVEGTLARTVGQAKVGSILNLEGKNLNVITTEAIAVLPDIYIWQHSNTAIQQLKLPEVLAQTLIQLRLPDVLTYFCAIGVFF